MTRICKWDVSSVLRFRFASEYLIRMRGKTIGCWNLLGSGNGKMKVYGEIVLEADVEINKGNNLSMCEPRVIVMCGCIIIHT
jgi:hypothetical protein